MAADEENGGGANPVSTAIAYCQAQVGKPYCLGGVGPKCYDCSGLMYEAYKSAGVNITRTTYSQLAALVRKGQVVSTSSGWKDRLEPGDLLYSTPVPGDEHVVMYIGGGKIVQAPHTGANVYTSTLADGFPYTPIGIRRPVPGAGSTATGSDGGGDTTTDTTDPDCLINLSVVGCLLGKADAMRLLGGVIMGGALLVGAVGLVICAQSAGKQVGIKLPSVVRAAGMAAAA